MQECPPDALCPRPEHVHSGNFVSFGCGENQYNDLATLFFNTQDDAIRNLFSAGTPHEYSMQALLLFFASFYVLMIITYGIAVPAGVPHTAAFCFTGGQALASSHADPPVKFTSQLMPGADPRLPLQLHASSQHSHEYSCSMPANRFCAAPIVLCPRDLHIAVQSRVPDLNHPWR